METREIVLDRIEARALWRKYREHQHYAKPIDWEIQRTYQLIAQGRVVIKALDSILTAGVGEDGAEPRSKCGVVSPMKRVHRGHGPSDGPADGSGWTMAAADPVSTVDARPYAVQITGMFLTSSFSCEIDRE